MANTPQSPKLDRWRSHCISQAHTTACCPRRIGLLKLQLLNANHYCFKFNVNVTVFRSTPPPLPPFPTPPLPVPALNSPAQRGPTVAAVWFAPLNSQVTTYLTPTQCAAHFQTLDHCVSRVLFIGRR